MMLWLKKIAVRHALLKPAPQWVSSSDPKLDAKAVLASFQKDFRPEYRVIGLEPQGFSAVTVGQSDERYRCSIPYSRSTDIKLKFRHWFRHTEAVYDTPLSYFWGVFSFEALRAEIRSTLRQASYNRSLKLREDRTDVLQAIVDEHLRRRSRSNAPVFEEVRIDRLEVANLLYGAELWGHPKHTEILARLDLVIDSLIDSNDLSSHQSRVTVNGKAVATIAARIEEDRRHRDQVNYNSAITRLTFGLLSVSAIQLVVTWIKG